MKSELVTQAENTVGIDALRTALNDHRARSFSTAHQGPIVIAGYYVDSKGLAVSSLILKVELDGIPLYIPCKIAVEAAPLS